MDAKGPSRFRAGKALGRVNERHLKRLMNEYVRYYHEGRTHLALGKSTPTGREEDKQSGSGQRVVSMPRLGGLHHRYDLVA